MLPPTSSTENRVLPARSRRVRPLIYWEHLAGMTLLLMSRPTRPVSRAARSQVSECGRASFAPRFRFSITFACCLDAASRLHLRRTTPAGVARAASAAVGVQGFFHGICAFDAVLEKSYRGFVNIRIMVRMIGRNCV